MEPLTIALSVAIGAYMVAAGIGIARNPASARDVIAELEASKALTIITGAFTFALGVALILAHNRWDNVVEGFISFFGWAAAIKGLILLAFPNIIYRFADVLAPSDSVARLFGVITIAVGGALLFIGIPILVLANSPV